MAARNTLNETRFIIDLDETALASLNLRSLVCTRACAPVRMHVHVQIMALPVCGLYHSSITCLRWLIDCHDYAPFSRYNTKHRIRIVVRFSVTLSLYALNVLSVEFTFPLISTRRKTSRIISINDRRLNEDLCYRSELNIHRSCRGRI